MTPPRKATFSAQSALVLSELQHNMLIGTLLGDGRVSAIAAGKTWSYNAVQGEAQKEYLFHKYEILKDFCLTPPNQQTVTEKGKTRTRWYFNTRRMGIFQYYGNLFYVPNPNPTPFGVWTKIVPPNIEELLNPTVFAYWFMDDGDQKWKGHSRAMRLSTQGFVESDVDLLRHALQKKFGLSTTKEKADVAKDGSQRYRIYLTTSCYDTLRDVLYPNLLPYMRYKFPD